MTDEQTLTPAQEYITANAISYSALSRLTDGPQAYINKDKPTGDFLSTGSAVDIQLTEPEKFNELFYVMTTNKPTSDMMLIYTEVMIATDDHAQALAASGYKKAVTDVKWQSDGLPYYKAIKAAKGKTVLSFEQYTQINNVVNQLKENEYTAQYFADEAEVQYDEIQYQFIHYFNFNGVPCKIKTDILTIDHTKKEIRGLDLKTTGKSVFAFVASYRSYKYYLQGGLYTAGIKDWASAHYPDYTVLDFEFIVAEMFTKNPPLVFTMTKAETAKALAGGTTSTGYKIKGVTELLADLDYYNETGEWNYPAEIHRNGGKVNLNLFV